PDLFLYAAQQLGEQPIDCVIVEDAAAGITAGISAGMITVGIGPVSRVGKADKVLVNGFQDVEFTQLFEELNAILR
ncbi:MAG: HAD-IA family hydrolase, partial [Anaerolineaceae bacterium]|nr:HAD-IA family hydrolase [Anaerolineaceae bacterium]